MIGMIYEFLPFMVLPLYTSLEKIENAVLEGPAAADQNVLKGRISFAAYLGNTLRYDVDLGSGIVFKADIRDPLHHEQRPMGTTVDLRFAAASAVAIPAA